MNTLLGVMLSFLRSTFETRAALALENAALRQQLAVYLRKQKRPQRRAGDRIFWMALSRVWSGWEVALAVVKPATVIAWHRKGFRWYWRAKSRSGKIGRPRIPRRHIDFILRISQEHSEWGEDRIAEDGKMRSYRCALDLWLHEVIGIEGLPIPYGAPNANPHAERFVRTLREEALNHFIFLDEKHVRRVVMDYIRYYNGARPSQAIHAIPDPYPELREPPPKDGELVALPVLGGLHHDYRLAA